MNKCTDGTILHLADVFSGVARRRQRVRVGEERAAGGVLIVVRTARGARERVVRHQALRHDRENRIA